MQTAVNKENNLYLLAFRVLPLIILFGLLFKFKSFNLYLELFNFSLGSVASFITALSVCFTVQILCSLNPILSSTKEGIVFSTILTTEMVLFLFFAEKHLIISVFILLGILLLILIINIKTLDENTKDKQLTVELRQWCVSYSNALVCILLCFIMLIPTGIGIYEEFFKASVSSEEREEIKSQCDTYLLTWDNLSFEEKKEAVKAFAKTESANLGLDGTVKIGVRVTDMDEGTLGYYRDNEKNIYISEEHLKYGDLIDILGTVAHEMHHAFAYSVINSLDYNSDFIKNSSYFEKARKWKENSENYTPASTNYDDYYRQALEHDAREYAENRQIDYMIRIDLLSE